MDEDRFNSPSTSAVILEVLGQRLQLSQDPNSKHHGTTVWDASIVFVKFLEKNSRKGRFSPSKVKGKRAIELGAGCGLAGLGMAMLGCDVISTDQVEVLPLLMRNVERNTSYIMQNGCDCDTFGSIEVAELNWCNKEHVKAVNPPFDYIIGTDVVYSENLLQPLLETILALSGPRTTVMLGYEIRSTVVHEQMLRMWNDNFDVKAVPKVKMDIKYRHPSIQLYLMEPKAKALSKESCLLECQTSESNYSHDEDCESCRVEDGKEDTESRKLVADEISGQQNEADEWETRRFGAMAARLLRDVKL